MLGREARPGERFRVLDPINAPGEPPHCVKYAGRTADQVRTPIHVPRLPGRGTAGPCQNSENPHETPRPSPRSTAVPSGCGGSSGKDDGIASVGGPSASEPPGGRMAPAARRPAQTGACLREHGVNMPDPGASELLYAGRPRPERRERAAESLRRVGLAHWLTHYPHQFMRRGTADG